MRFLRFCVVLRRYPALVGNYKLAIQSECERVISENDKFIDFFKKESQILRFKADLYDSFKSRHPEI